MLYSIVGQDVENSLEGRKQARPAHLARLEALRDEGRLILAGPNPSQTPKIQELQDSAARL